MTNLSERAPYACLALLASGVACVAEIPPYPETVIVIDTDLPVPRVASRLRIDLYSADGTWFDSRDYARPDPRDWPTSFGVYTDDATRDKTVFVRLRVYPDGRVVRYTGAIWAPARDLLRAIPSGDGQPRLVGAGVDRTPTFEPDPTVTVDRLLRVTLASGPRARERVILHGACAGVVAKTNPIREGASCIEDPAQLVPAADVPFDLTANANDAASAQGSFARAACAPPSNGDSRRCVEGGAFLFGDAFYRPTSIGAGAEYHTRPERVVVLSPFLMDVDEVNVARYRAALARGFVPSTSVGATERDGPVGDDPTRACTFSAAPLGREDDPLSCVPWETARAFCAFEGGDLPTEAQWEYAAVAAARAAKSAYPWGDDPPSCDRAIYGRSYVENECADRGLGPQPISAAGDQSAAGIKNLAGSLTEHMRDNAASFDEDCWLDAPMRDPSCSFPVPPSCAADPSSLGCIGERSLLHMVRGGSWLSSSLRLGIIERVDAARVGKSQDDSEQGFRCVYSAN
jgi:formylglycine-generating enzyme required for sulfatase activity